MEKKFFNKTMFLVLTIAFIETVFPISLHGQSNIRVTEDAKRRQSIPLNGKAQAVFVSRSKNLFIESSRPSLDIKQTPSRNLSGKWEYVIEMQLQSSEGPVKDRTFTITQSGSTDKATFSKKTFVGDNRYYFLVEEVKNPIFLVDKTSPTDGHFVSGEAKVEINSLLKIKVNTNPKLPCRIENNRSDAGYYSTSLIIDMKQYESLRNKLRRQQIEYDDLNENLLERADKGENVSNDEWNTLEAMQNQLERIAAQFSELSTIIVSADESNELAINTENLQAKQKWVYSVESNKYSSWSRSYSRKRWLVMANYAYTLAPQHSFGITVAQVGRFGWYVNLMTNGRFTLPSQTCSEEDALSLGSNSYFWTGEKSTTRWSAIVGGIFALKEFGYLYAGAGYGTRNLVWYTQSGLPIGIESSCYQDIALDAGMIINLSDHWPISLGYSGIGLFKYNEIKLAIGYRF